MRIVGLDLSLRAPGWFVRETDGTMSHGTFTPTGKEMLRVGSIVEFVRSLLAPPVEPSTIPIVARYLGCSVVIEGYSFGSNSSHARSIAEAGGVVRYWLWCNRIPYVEVPPSQLKKFVTGKGNVEKNIVIREVYKRWGVDAKDDNEADAYVLGRIGMCLAGIDEPTTEFQRAIIVDIQKKASQAA